MEKDKLSCSELRNIFYSGYSCRVNYACLDNLKESIDFGAVLYDKEILADTVKYHQKLSQGICHVPSGIGGDEKGHRVLKKLARELLSSKGFDSVYEVRFCGCFADVLSKNFQRVIECGTTNPERVIFYLKDSRVKVFSVLPYPFFEDSFLVIHSFQRGPNFNKMLENERAKLRKLHNQVFDRKLKDDYKKRTKKYP